MTNRSGFVGRSRVQCRTSKDGTLLINLRKCSTTCCKIRQFTVKSLWIFNTLQEEQKNTKKNQHHFQPTKIQRNFLQQKKKKTFTKRSSFSCISRYFLSVAFPVRYTDPPNIPLRHLRDFCQHKDPVSQDPARTAPSAHDDDGVVRQSRQSRDNFLTDDDDDEEEFVVSFIK